MGAFGKQRRTLDLGDAGVGSFCDPLVGFKAGVEFLVTPKFVLAPAVGVAVNLDERSRTSLFADLELNYLFGNGAYVGTGVGVWDFNHSANVAGNLLIHTGVPLIRYTDNSARLLVVFEGRLFFDQLDNIANNYQGWVGLRYRFR